MYPGAKYLDSLMVKMMRVVGNKEDMIAALRIAYL